MSPVVGTSKTSADPRTPRELLTNTSWPAVRSSHFGDLKRVIQTASGPPSRPLSGRWPRGIVATQSVSSNSTGPTLNYLICQAAEATCNCLMHEIV